MFWGGHWIVSLNRSLKTSDSACSSHFIDRNLRGGRFLVLPQTSSFMSSASWPEGKTLTKPPPWSVGYVPEHLLSSGRILNPNILCGFPGVSGSQTVLFEVICWIMILSKCVGIGLWCYRVCVETGSLSLWKLLRCWYESKSTCAHNIAGDFTMIKNTSLRILKAPAPTTSFFLKGWKLIGFRSRY